MLPSQFDYSRTVTYNGKNHLSVILQNYGSINRKVLPYCIWNVSVAVVIVMLLPVRDLTISIDGHNFMSLLVGFLVVSRASITFSLYFEFRGFVEALFQSTRSIVDLYLSYHGGSSNRLDALQVAYSAMKMLESSVLMMAGQDAREDFGYFMFHEETKDSRDGNWYHGKTKASDWNLSMTIRRAHHLRTLLAKTGTENSFAVYHAQQAVDQYLNGYYGIRKYLTTPFPFPLVQMSRFVLFLYVLTLPFAVLSADSTIPQAMLVLFISTYGFLGIEQVSIELDNPFGDDPSDFPIREMAECVYDDIAWMIQTQFDAKSVEQLLRDFGSYKQRADASGVPMKPDELSALL